MSDEFLNQENQTSTTLHDYLNIIFKRKWLCLLVIFIFTIGSYYNVSNIKDTYTSNAKILLKYGWESMNADALTSTTDARGYFPLMQHETTMNTAVDILTGKGLAEKVVERLGVDAFRPKIIKKDTHTVEESSFLEKTKKGVFKFISSGINSCKDLFVSNSGIYTPMTEEARAVYQVASGINAKVIEETQSISISFTASTPELANKVLTATVDIFQEDFKYILYRNKDANEFVGDQLIEAKKELEKVENDLIKLKKDHQVIEIKSELTALAEEIRELTASIHKTEEEIIISKENVAAFEKLLEELPKEYVTETVSIDHSLMDRLYEKLGELELEEQALLTKFSEDSVKVKDVKIKKSIILERLKEAKPEKRVTGIMKVNNPEYSKAEASLREHQTVLNSAMKKLEVLQGRIKQATDLQKELIPIEIEFAKLQSEKIIQEDQVSKLRAKKSQTDYEDSLKAKNINNIKKIQNATWPWGPDDAKRMRYMILGIFAGLIVAVGLAFGLDYLNNTVKKPEEIEKLIELPTLVLIPDIKKFRKGGFTFVTKDINADVLEQDKRHWKKLWKRTGST